MLEARQFGGSLRGRSPWGAVSDTTNSELVVGARWEGTEFMLIAT